MVPLDPALLAAVLDPANDGDDALRLACADWWEDHGEAARAEFVRVQVELAGFYPNLAGGVTSAGSARIDFLKCREGELLARYYRHWLPAGLWDAVVARGEGVPFPQAATFRRGFVEHVACAAAGWITHGDAILAAQPVRAVTLTTRPEARICSPGESFYDWFFRRWPRVREWHLIPDPADYSKINQLLAAIHDQPV